MLDLRRPGWYREINIAQLDIARGQDCICVQLFGGYAEGIAALQIGRDAHEYGFNVPWSGYTDLTAAWRDVIAERRLAEIPVAVLPISSAAHATR